ncbi:hypothetical protein SKAU_G00297190 [Synaphobranchus kaupii]|uniref:Uncharacterized protein n=1 Tax=Synaphobranchus kaupii TaxID=118154 RepID=A0A9Q1EV03_SYNKA|nr:hypothetical protein SKAU_G00297190 [Synaphobranchus kaupii]
MGGWNLFGHTLPNPFATLALPRRTPETLGALSPRTASLAPRPPRPPRRRPRPLQTQKRQMRQDYRDAETHGQRRWQSRYLTLSGEYRNFSSKAPLSAVSAKRFRLKHELRYDAERRRGRVFRRNMISL